MIGWGDRSRGAEWASLGRLGRMWMLRCHEKGRECIAFEQGRRAGG